MSTFVLSVDAEKARSKMADQPIVDEEAVLRAVQHWPRERQLRLAHRLLDPGLATLNPQTGRPYVSSTELRGMGLGGRPAPSDEEIERWRMEKYDG